jgi:hypothetical protein
VPITGESSRPDGGRNLSPVSEAETASAFDGVSPLISAGTGVVDEKRCLNLYGRCVHA